MKRAFAIFLIMAVTTVNLAGNLSNTQDTLRRSRVSHLSAKRLERFILPAPFIATGIAIYGKPGERFQQLRNNYFTNFSNHADEFLRFSPTVLLYSLKIAGVQSRSSWERLILTNAISGVLMVGSVQGLKMIIKEPRPDGSESNGFPSGHSALAFMSATMVHHEYGLTESPWYSIAAYSLASATAALRVLNNSHYMQDVIMGAGMGILSTELGYMISELIYSNRGILRESRESSEHRVPVRGYSFMGASLEYVKILNNPVIDGNIYRASWGTGATLESIFHNPSREPSLSDIGIHISANANTALIKRVDNSGSSIPINWLTLAAGPALSVKVGNIMRVGITAEAGYSRIILNNNLPNERSSSGLYAGGSFYIERELVDRIVLRLFSRCRNSVHSKPTPDISSISFGGTMSVSIY